MQHACAGTPGATHAEVADTPVSTDGHRPPGSHPSFANAFPQGAPQLRQPWGSPIPGAHSPAPSLPKFIGFVILFSHSTQPTQLTAAAGAGLQEAAAEGPPARFLPCTR